MHSDQPYSADRRSEPRQMAHGTVMLRPRGATTPAIAGRLIDISKSGFRARHQERALLPGQEVDFEVAGVRGSARVVWTRIAGGRVESGFLILEQDGV